MLSILQQNIFVTFYIC